MLKKTEIVACHVDDMELLVKGFSMNELLKDGIVSVDYIEIESNTNGAEVIHYKTDEMIFPLQGEMQAKIDGKISTVSVGDFIKIKMGTPHRFDNNTKNIAKFISICYPPFSKDDVTIIG